MRETVNDAKTFQRNAKGVRELLSMKFETLAFEGAWRDAFGTPERRGVWMVWGNTGNGKTSFVMQLCKELCRFGRVAYDSLEEGACLTMQNTLKRFNMQEVNRRFLLLDAEPLDQLSLRLKRQKAPDFRGDRQFPIYADDIRPVYQVQGTAPQQVAYLHQSCQW